MGIYNWKYITEVIQGRRKPLVLVKNANYQRATPNQVAQVVQTLKMLTDAVSPAVNAFFAIEFTYRGMHRVGDTGPFDRRYRSALQEAKAILTSIHEEIEEYGLSKGDPTAGNPIALIERITTRFHAVARQLRARRAERPTLDVKDEYDAQDLLHALLRIFFKDVRPEEWTPSYAGSSSRMDFLLRQEEIVIEVKMTREGLKQKDLVDQLLVDIARYEEHPSCKSLICFVYDPDGRIGNPSAIIADIEKGDRKIAVRVFVQPEHS
jgi:hypothetical protein